MCGTIGTLATIQHAHLIIVLQLACIVWDTNGYGVDFSRHMCQHYTAIKIEWGTLFVRAL